MVFSELKQSGAYEKAPTLFKPILEYVGNEFSSFTFDYHNTTCSYLYCIKYNGEMIIVMYGNYEDGFFIDFPMYLSYKEPNIIDGLFSRQGKIVEEKYHFYFIHDLMYPKVPGAAHYCDLSKAFKMVNHVCRNTQLIKQYRNKQKISDIENDFK